MRFDREGDAAVLTVTHVEPLPRRAKAVLAAEGRRLLRFIAADAAAHEVRVASL